MEMGYDVAVIGAGVIGNAIARELSRYQYRIVVLGREADFCEGTSKANSGIVHAGFDCEPGTVMAGMNVRGNKMMDHLCAQLDIPFKRNGSLVLCMDEKDNHKLEKLMEKGKKNGVPGLRILSGKEVREMEPAISENVCSALYAPTGGVICPFELTIALGENARENGVKYNMCTEVTNITRENGVYRISTNKGEVRIGIVINAAGV